MAVKADGPGAPAGGAFGQPAGAAEPAPSRTSAEAPIAFLCFSALGAQLALEAATVRTVLELRETHAPARFGDGLVMVHEGHVMPMVDFRRECGKDAPLLGGPLLVSLVYGRKFGIAVDRLHGRINVAYGEIRIPDDGLARQTPYLAGSVWREGIEVFLIDSDRLLGPAVRTHLLKTI